MDRKFSICAAIIGIIYQHHLFAFANCQLVIYKDLEQGGGTEAKCVFIQPTTTTAELEQPQNVQLKMIDEVTFKDFEVLDVRKLDAKQAKFEWDEEAARWCEGLAKFTVIVEDKDNIASRKTRRKRSVRYNQPSYREWYGTFNRRRAYEPRRQTVDIKSPSWSNFGQRQSGRWSVPSRRSHNSREYASRQQPSRSYRNYHTNQLRAKNHMMPADDPQVKAVANSNKPAPLISIDGEQGGMNTFSQVQIQSSGANAEAQSNGGMSGRSSDSSVSGSYTDKGTFSAQARSGFPDGETKVQVQGTDTGSSAESIADVQKLGRALSKTQLAPKGISMANAEGSFADGSTFVQSQGNTEGGKSSARANSQGQTSSNAEVIVQGGDGQAETYDGISSARSGGNDKGAHAHTQVQGTYQNKNKYIAMASGGFGEFTDKTDAKSDADKASIDSNLASIPLENTRRVDPRRRRVGSDDLNYRPNPGYDDQYGRGIEPAELGPTETRAGRQHPNYRRTLRSRTGTLPGRNGNVQESRLGPSTTRNLRKPTGTGSQNGNGVDISRTGPIQRPTNGGGDLRTRGSNYGQNRRSSGKAACCNAQYICCMTCCPGGNENRPQGDGPRTYYKNGKTIRYNPRKAIGTKKPRLMKYTNELQSDQPVQRYGGRPKYSNRRLSELYSKYRRGTTGRQKAPLRYNTNAYRNHYRRTARPIVSSESRIDRKSGYGYFSKAPAHDRNRLSRRLKRCKVQYRCTYRASSYGRVRHCKPYKPAGCS